MNLKKQNENNAILPEKNFWKRFRLCNMSYSVFIKKLTGVTGAWWQLIY